MSNKMKTWSLAGLAGVILVGLALLIWNLRSGGSGSATPEASAGSRSSTAGAVGSRGRPGAVGVPGGEAAAPGDDTPAQLSPDEHDSIDMERILQGEAPRRVRAAAAVCYDGTFSSYKELERQDKSIDIEYTLMLKNGTYSLQDVKLTDSLGKPKLEDCVVEEVSAISWKDPVNADFTMPMSDSISLLALKKYGEPMPHELEEIPEDPANADFGPKLGLPNPEE
jgi:hypothetical protein